MAHHNYHSAKAQLGSDIDTARNGIDYRAMVRKIEACQHVYQMDSFGSGDTVAVYYQCSKCGKIVMGDVDPTETGTLKPGMELPI